MPQPSPLYRFAIFGAESTGKTTLARRLAEHFGAPWAPEFVRGFWDERGGKIGAADLDGIARGQIAGEEAGASRVIPPAGSGPAGAGRILFCDTELLTNVLWADLLFPGSCPAWVRAEAERRCRSYALYLLCDTDAAFEPDPQRCFPDEAGRAMCRRLWRETLETRGLPFVDIRGAWTERERAAIAAVSKALQAPED